MLSKADDDVLLMSLVTEAALAARALAGCTAVTLVVDEAVMVLVARALANAASVALCTVVFTVTDGLLSKLTLVSWRGDDNGRSPRCVEENGPCSAARKEALLASVVRRANRCMLTGDDVSMTLT